MPALAPATVGETLADKPEIRIQPVRSGVVAEIWHHVEPMIRAAVAEGPGDESVADILEFLSRRDYQLWLVLVDGKVKAALITALVNRPRAKVCRLDYLGGGDVDQWIEVLDETICGWARQNGCDAVEPCGRRGWGKFAKRLGYHVSLTTHRKKL